MTSYVVKWNTIIVAKSPEDAATQARKVMLSDRHTSFEVEPYVYGDIETEDMEIVEVHDEDL